MERIARTKDGTIKNTDDNASLSTFDVFRQKAGDLSKILSQERLKTQQADKSRDGKEVLETSKKLTVVTTDFGADSDDQKAVLGLIEGLKVGKEIAFIVSGPHPELAAAAIAQKYQRKTGQYPLIATGKQFEKHLIPEDRIYSLVDGNPIKDHVSSVNIPKVSLQEFQSAIDAKIKDGDIDIFTQIVIAPLHAENEYYNPSRDKLKIDNIFQEEWKKIEKVSITQFQRTNDGTYKGNNYSKSEKGIADSYIAHLQKQEFQQVYIEGAVAKSPEFLLTMKQPNQPGIQKTIENYIASMQVPWLNMTEPVGTTPSPENMHVGMFTSGTEVPFGVHVSGKNPAGFGAERIVKEVYGISRQEIEKYTATMRPILEELNTFDQQVLTVLQKSHSDIKDVPKMRKELHIPMMNTLQEFAKKKKIIRTDTTVGSFKELFELADAQGISLNAYTYMKEFKKILFESSPLASEITGTAEKEKDNKRANGLSHVETMTNAIGDKARAVVYDAVATVAGRVVLRNKKLQEHFTEEESKIINITPDRINKLREEKPHLYTIFVKKVRQGLAKDGCQLAQ